MNSDGLNPQSTILDVLLQDKNEDYSGNSDIASILKSDPGYLFGNDSSQVAPREFGILALPLGFVFGSAIASALRHTLSHF